MLDRLGSLPVVAFLGIFALGLPADVVEAGSKGGLGSVSSGRGGWKLTRLQP